MEVKTKSYISKAPPNKSFLFNSSIVFFPNQKEKRLTILDYRGISLTGSVLTFLDFLKNIFLKRGDSVVKASKIGAFV